MSQKGGSVVSWEAGKKERGCEAANLKRWEGSEVAR